MSDKDTISVPRNDPRLWHVWYDDYERGTMFITEGSYSDRDDPRVVDEGVPYQEALERVMKHNKSLFPQEEPNVH